MDFNRIINIAEILACLGVEDVILSPGSRNAPLTLALVRNKQLKSFVVSDERSAAFMGLGMVLKKKKPVVLACTSGSAGYNYAPAIAEAFFQQLPLIVFTADRPPEWIDQRDGQTIHQDYLYGDHVKKSFIFPDANPSPDVGWHMERMISEAVHEATAGRKGPVHINFPFREPFYPTEDEWQQLHPPRVTRSLQSVPHVSEQEWMALIDEWANHEKKLILAGQGEPSIELIDLLEGFESDKFIPVLGDVISNIHSMKDGISLGETFLGNISQSLTKSLTPDLLITFGKSIISKNTKIFLRKNPPKEHWHIDPYGPWPDTYQCLTRIIPTNPEHFFSGLADIGSKGLPRYQQLWKKTNETSKGVINQFHAESSFNEFSVVNMVLDNLPLECDVHLANSMPVRWANYFDIDHTHNDLTIFANRGTSGIDGCTSTALGSAISTQVTTLLITGDMAFFYDRNAFWNRYVPDNLRIVMLNNHGGGIFDIIRGPDKVREKDEFFITEQPLTARSLASEHGLDYFFCRSFAEVSTALDDFWVRTKRAKILEVETNIKDNTNALNSFKKLMKKQWS